MRLSVFSVALLAMLSPALQASGEDSHYFHKGKRIELKLKPEKSYVLLQEETAETAVADAAKEAGGVLREFRQTKSLKSLNLAAAPPPKLRWAIIENKSAAAAPLELNALTSEVVYSAPFYTAPSGEEVGISHLFYVKLKKEEDKADLAKLAKKHKVEIIGSNKFMPLWYTLSCTKDSSGNSLEVANAFHATNEFSVAEPDFLVNYRLESANDEHYTKQWGLKNTGQNSGKVGIDIGIEDAWNVTTGDSSVKVAVVDHGIELDHPDLSLNMAADSYDAIIGTSPSFVRGDHGTACAGIVAAGQNNGGNGKVGVTGVAPGCKLMSVSHSLMTGPNASQELADGINWAWQNGAAVISNSWGHSALASSQLDDAIELALTDGRGGLGTVVVFAAGNANSDVIYPADSNRDIIVVGAMSPCGERKSLTSCDPENFWGSCFGDEVDVVGPGVLIATTDRKGSQGYDSSDYTFDFNGTSSACPCVAGVAALVLSVNPDLTQKQVADLIEKTARKVGPYSYATTSGRTNGKWHEEMGHGLVNAKAAVAAAAAIDNAPGRDNEESLALKSKDAGGAPEDAAIDAAPRVHTKSPLRIAGTFEKSDRELPLSLDALTREKRPNSVVLTKNGSTFDLAKGGVMHLHLEGDTLWSAPLQYLGEAENILVYRDAGDDGWFWFFQRDGAVYFLAEGSEPQIFDDAPKWLVRSP